MEERPVTYIYVLAVIIGLLLVPLKLIYTFFPFFNLTDFIVFGLIGGIFGFSKPTKLWLWPILLFAPTLLLILMLVVRWLGVANLQRGIGTGWIISMLIIPLATFFGSHLGARFAHRRASLTQT